MSRIDCISNRNIRIVSEYVSSKLGHQDSLFEGLSYPTDRYASADAFFLNEDEWTTYQNYQLIFRKARELTGNNYFYFDCGASSAHLRSWGRLSYFERIFATPSDGFKRIPFFNKNLNDTKDIEVVLAPTFNRSSGKMRVVLKVQYHNDIDVHRDYIADPYRRGLISSIPTVWGLNPATVKQPLNPYDPEILFNEEPEFKSFGLDVRIKDNFLTVVHPDDGQRRIIGRRIFLEPDMVNGHEVYLGKFTDMRTRHNGYCPMAFLITETIQVGPRIVFKNGEIFNAPYFILDVTFDKISLVKRIAQIFKLRGRSKESEHGFVETIDRLREEIEGRNKAYREVEAANRELKTAKQNLEEYSKNLEGKVEERTIELKQAQDELLRFNEDLKTLVTAQVEELERYNELRRYLSPHFAEKILSSGGRLRSTPQRKMMTVMFTDIRDFSSLTDNLEPEETFQLLDRYLSEMTKLIHRYEGTLNKIIGDGLLIFFGDPIPIRDHAERAVMMAIDMQKKVAELRREWFQFGNAFGIGVGVNTGYMTVGSIGSDIHKDYTVIGNQVNVASRLEAQATAGQILISQRTYSRIKGLVEVERMGRIQVKGFHMPVDAYNVVIP